MTRTPGRHRKTRQSPGPITGAMAVVSNETRTTLWLLRLWPLFPALFLVFPTVRNVPLGPHADVILGLDAMLCLVACVTVTPMITIMKARVAKLRWWYGVWMFTLGAAGLTIHMWMGRDNWTGAAGGNSVNWTGLLLVVLLFPMAVTANSLAQKALGPEWKRWQRTLIWVVWVVVLVHLLALMAWLSLGAFLAATIPLILARRWSKPIKAWRTGGYSTGGWWAVLGALTVTYLAGVFTLVIELGVACAEAVY